MSLPRARDTANRTPIDGETPLERRPGQANLASMKKRATLEATAVELRTHIARLEAERSLALATGLGAIDLYMAHLDEELDGCRQAYTAAAVTEIATLQAELWGANQG
jgi:hypothetical protein